ncbi:MAG: hypothetical protein CMM07_04725 [Rhodopirellula sp.]|nr:hypothetical protein [Rhodopirellula sp.]
MSEVSLKSEDNESLEAVERYLADIAAHSSTSSDFASFAVGLLEKTLSILNAQGGGIWVCGTPPDLHLQCHCNLELTGTDGAFLENHRHTGFLQSVLQAGKPQVATPKIAGSPGHIGDSTLDTNESSLYWIACPLTFRDEVIGIIEVLQAASSNEDLIRGNIKLLTMAADLTADFLRQQQLHEMQESDLRWQQYENLVHQLNSDLDLTRTAFQIVNGCRCYLDCDRFTLLLPMSRRLRTFAISGTDSFDRGSRQIQKLEVLSEAVMLSRKSLRFRGDMESLPPQLEKPLSDYVDQSHANGIDVIPLFHKADTGEIQQPLGVLVIESFQGYLTPARELMIPRVANLADMTLRNSVDYNSLPLLSVARLARRVKQRVGPQRTKFVIVISLVLISFLVMVLTPASYRVGAEGELQPQLRRNIYAPSEGEIATVQIDHNEMVKKGALLLVLRSPTLDLEGQKLQGEYLANSKKLRSIQAERVQINRSEDSYELRSQRLSASEEELMQLIESQQTQIRMMNSEREALNILSPIDGQVLTWNPVDMLANRPIQRGQRLLTVADTNGSWIVELLVPDHKIGAIIAAQRETKKPLEVTFQLATDRGITYEAKLLQVAGRTETVEQQQPMVKILAEITNPRKNMLRPDATVFAKINCGTQSLGYVLFHDFFEKIKTWILMR